MNISFLAFLLPPLSSPTPSYYVPTTSPPLSHCFATFSQLLPSTFLPPAVNAVSGKFLALYSGNGRVTFDEFCVLMKKQEAKLEKASAERKSRIEEKRTIVSPL